MDIPFPPLTTPVRVALPGMYSRILGLTWVYMSSAVWSRNSFWTNSQASINTNKVLTRLITLSERVQSDGPDLVTWKPDSSPKSVGRAHAVTRRVNGATGCRPRCESAAPHLCGIVVCIRRCANAAELGAACRVMIWPPVVVLVVSKGGNPAAGPNHKKHWTDWLGCRFPAALLCPVF